MDTRKAATALGRNLTLATMDSDSLHLSPCLRPKNPDDGPASILTVIPYTNQSRRPAYARSAVTWLSLPIASGHATRTAWIASSAPCPPRIR